MRTRLAALAAGATAAAAAAATAIVVTAAPASAAGPMWPANGTWVGSRAPVCAQDIEVRSSPDGPAIAHLYYGQTIQVDQVSSEWVHGFAYGDANVYGWIQNGWFCGP